MGHVTGFGIGLGRRNRRIIIETDSKKAYSFVKKGYRESAASNVIVRRCLELLFRDWEMELSHIFREMNEVADGLCKLLLRRELSYHLLDEPPSSVMGLLEADSRGVTHYRWVPGNVL